jgi:hypothetical protein
MIRLQDGGFCDQAVKMAPSYQDLHDYGHHGC